MVRVEDGGGVVVVEEVVVEEGYPRVKDMWMDWAGHRIERRGVIACGTRGLGMSHGK